MNALHYRSIAPSLLILAAAACSSAPPSSDPSSETAVQKAPLAAARNVTRTPIKMDSEAPEKRAQKDWRRSISKTPTPKAGCFTSSLGSSRWDEVACGGPPKSPNLGRSQQEAMAARLAAMAPGSARAETVGNGADGAALAASLVNWAEGSFPSESGGASETGSGGTSNGSNSYSLQMNTNAFSTPACNSQPNCLGWEQFVYDAANGQVSAELSLINYSGDCPSGYPDSYTSGSQQVCYLNTNTLSVPSVAASDLGNVSMTVTTGSGNVYLVTTINGQAYNYPLADTLKLASGWTGAEFNVFGEDNGGVATFNSATSLEVQVLLDTASGTRAAPSCPPSKFNGWTGETNSLNLIPGSCCPFGGNSPGIQFLESTNASATPPVCPALTLGGPISAPEGSLYPATVTVAGGLVDSSLNAGLAPDSCSVTGPLQTYVTNLPNEVGAPEVDFEIPLSSLGESFSESFTCDTSVPGAWIPESVTSTASQFFASPSTLTLEQGGASGYVAWEFPNTTLGNQLGNCASSYSIASLPAGFTYSIASNELTLSAGMSVAANQSYTVDVTASGCPSDYTASVTVNVTPYVPEPVCSVATCPAPNTCLDGECYAAGPSKPSPPPRGGCKPGQCM